VKYIFFTTGYTTEYGLLVAFDVARFAVRLGGLVGKLGAGGLQGDEFESRVDVILFSCYISLST